MQDLILLTDGSVHPQLKIGYGAYLAVPDPSLSLDELRPQVKLKRFVQTTSTKLELQTLLWALSEIQLAGRRLFVYTDSQAIFNLPIRRARLEEQKFCSNKLSQLNNADLYREFYREADRLNFELFKLAGHKSAKQKSPLDRLFSLVDKASRQALREAIG